MTNLHWILWLAAATVVCCAALGHRIDRRDTAFVLVAAASSPLGLLLVLLLAGAMVIAPDASRPIRRLMLATLAIALIQLAASFLSPRNVLPDAVVTLHSPVGWLLDQVYRRGPFGARGLLPGWAVGSLATVAFAALVAFTARKRDDDSPDLATGSHPVRWRGPLTLVALGGACAVAFAGSTYLNRHDTARYDLIPQAGLVIVLVLATTMLATALGGRVGVAGRSIGLGSVATAAVALMLVVGYATTFRLRNAASEGPSYPAAYRAAAAACDAGAARAVIAVSPLPKGSITTTFSLSIPYDRIRD